MDEPGQDAIDWETGHWVRAGGASDLGAGYIPRPRGAAAGSKRLRLVPPSGPPYAAPRPRPSSREEYQDKVVLTPKTGWGNGKSGLRPSAAPPQLRKELATTAKSSGAAPALNGTRSEHMSNGSSSFAGKMAPGVPVFLAPATADIVPVSSRASASSSSHRPTAAKRIAMQFVASDQQTQMRMLKDPHIARAILETLDESQLGGVAATQMLLPGVAPPAPPPGALPPGAPPPAWAGSITLARNMGKRLLTRAALLHGSVADVEVALRCAAGNHNVLDITHRMPFDEVARRAPSGTLLSLVPNSSNDIVSLEEYARYFRAKMRAGVARLDEAHSLYVLPPAEDIQCLHDTVYSLSPHILRSGCLLGLIASGAAPAGLSTSAGTLAASTTRDRASNHAADPRRDGTSPGSATSPGAARAEQASAAARADEDGLREEIGMSPGKLVDLFSNPELIKLLSDDAP